MDVKLVMSALAQFTEVFHSLPPYQQKELFRLVLHKAIVSSECMELALYGKPPELNEMAQTTPRSEI